MRSQDAEKAEPGKGSALLWFWVGLFPVGGGIKPVSQSLRMGAHDGVSRCYPPGQSMTTCFSDVGCLGFPPAAFLSVSCARSLRKGALPVRRFRRTLFPHGVAAAIRRPCRHRIGRLVQRFCRGNGAEQNLSGPAINIDQPFSADRRTYQRA